MIIIHYLYVACVFTRKAHHVAQLVELAADAYVQPTLISVCLCCFCSLSIALNIRLKFNIFCMFLLLTILGPAVCVCARVCSFGHTVSHVLGQILHFTPFNWGTSCIIGDTIGAPHLISVQLHRTTM